METIKSLSYLIDFAIKIIKKYILDTIESSG